MDLENTQNLAASDTFHLGDPMRITKNDTNLRRGHTLLSKLADVLINLKNRNKKQSLKIIDSELTYAWKNKNMKIIGHNN